MEYLIRFVQLHETFRKPETDAIADLEVGGLCEGAESPFAIVRFHDTTDSRAAAQTLMSRSMLGIAIYELWGDGTDYDTLHANVRARTESRWPQHQKSTFRFEIDSFHGSHSMSEQRDIIETFGYMGIWGGVAMKKPDIQFLVCEEYSLDEQGNTAGSPQRLFFGRLVAESGRKAMNKYTLKKRSYIATTSMDSELALVTANLAQAAPGRIAYDPFTGTGSFPIACAHYGATVFGSDLDGRSIRGKGGRSVAGNFKQYGTAAQYLGGLVADLTNTPIRQKRILDAVVCDPPYGVREGLKVLGSTKVALQEVVYLANGLPAHLQSNYIPPKKSYSFLRMLDDVLDFAAERLVDGGRLCMWMPVAAAPDSGEDDDDVAYSEEKTATEYDIPRHPALQLSSVCQQDFNKWSRRLLTYVRSPDGEIDGDKLLAYKAERLAVGDARGVCANMTADELNGFRKQYFEGFKNARTNAKQH